MVHPSTPRSPASRTPSPSVSSNLPPESETRRALPTSIPVSAKPEITRIAAGGVVRPQPSRATSPTRTTPWRSPSKR